MTDTSNSQGSDLPTPPGHVDPGSSDPQDPVRPGGPVPPGAPSGPGGPTEPDITPDQPNQPGGPGVPSPEPNPPSPSEPTIPTPTEPTVPSPAEPMPGAPDAPNPGVPDLTGAGSAASASSDSSLGSPVADSNAAEVLNVPGTADMPANSSSSAHPDQPDQRADDSDQRDDGSGGEGSERFVRGDVSGSEPNLGSLAEDVAHPFDQTNGILDQLEGDADDPERVQERLGDPKAFGDAFSGSAEEGVDYSREEVIEDDEEP
ncbi:hypothetical protein [Humibacter sp.]|uniref:hypothetical protein n=1 Tax=Humibacter sp. TaxID=1940291 RepID=UPI003F81CA08